MIKLTDELIMQYIDGELAPDLALEVQQQLLHEPQWAIKVEEFNTLQSNISNAFKMVDDKPMPKGVLSALQEESNVIPLNKSYVSNRSWFWPTSVAASITIVFFLGFLFNENSLKENHPGINSTVIAQLNTLATGSQREGIKITGSYLNSDGGFCRTFQLSLETTQVNALSCQTQLGDWEVLAYVPSNLNDVYLPASGETSNLSQFVTDNLTRVSVLEEKAYLKDH